MTTPRPNNEGKVHLKGPWNICDNSIWIASTVSLQRNIEKFFFPGKLSAEKRKQLFSLLSNELMTRKDYAELKAEESSPHQKEYLFEHFLTPRSFPQAHVGEGFIYNKEGTFFAGINMHDHLYLQLTDCKGDLEKSWNTLSKIEMDLGKALIYSFSVKFGFLTATPGDCGSAFRVRAFLQLPAMIHTHSLEDFFAKHQDESVVAEGMQGKDKEFIGDMVVVRNNYTLGVTEENILSSVRSFCTKLIVHEKGLRSHLSDNDEMKDKVSRAFAILMHSYQIEVTEALKAISLMKLGLELGWLKGVTLQELNHLFFSCRRAHLQNQFSEEIAHEAFPHKRSEYIHKTLAKAELTI